MGLYQSISSIGFLSAGIIGGILLDTWGYSTANQILAVGTFLVIPIAFSLQENSVEPSHEYEQGFNLSTLVGDSDLFSLGVGVMLTRLFLGSLISSTLSLYLIEVIGAEGITFLGRQVGIASLTGFLLSFRIITKFALGPVIGSLSDKFGRQRTMFVLFMLGAGSLMMLCFSRFLGVITLSVILAFLSETGLGVVVASQVSDLVISGDANSKYTLSAFTNWIDIGSALGPLVIFSLISNISFNLIFLSSSAVLLLYALYIRKAF